jgi:hypothetical protein
MRKYIFGIQYAEVQHIAEEKMGRRLNSDELYQVQKGIQFGLECWEDVIGYAVDELMDSQEKSVDQMNIKN